MLKNLEKKDMLPVVLVFMQYLNLNDQFEH